MVTKYTETPGNFCDINDFVESDVSEIKNSFFHAKRVIFYDACSFQRHSGLPDNEKHILINYFRVHETLILITRCILMELASDQHRLAKNHIDLIKDLSNSGVKVVIFNEEYTYDILSECFSTKAKINEYLTWAVRTVCSPVSTIKETLQSDKKLTSEVIEGKRLKQSDMYSRFFTAVRTNKEHADNLGEELIAICVHILSHLPGISDGKLCVLTDDKGAAGKIDSVMKRTNQRNRGAKIILFSTPKLVQYMFQEKVPVSEGEMTRLISQGTYGNVVIMGTTAFDLKVDEKISMTCSELVRRIMESNGINIVF